MTEAHICISEADRPGLLRTPPGGLQSGRLPATPIRGVRVGRRVRTWLIAASAVVLLAGFAGCSRVEGAINPAYAEMQSSAQSMARSFELSGDAFTPAVDMFGTIVSSDPHSGNSMTILEATGTKMHGEVILHFHVSADPGTWFHSGHYIADGCYRFTLHYDITTEQIPCPNHGPIKLHPVPTTTFPTSCGGSCARGPGG